MAKKDKRARKSGFKTRKKSKKTRVLVTGGSGFLGEIFCRYLRNKGYDVHILDKGINNDLEKEGFVTHLVDIRNKKKVDEFFDSNKRFEHVFHLAALLAYHIEPDIEVWRTNVYGTKNVVEAAVRNKSKSFIFVSSNAIYGIPRKLPVTEKTPFNPMEVYGKSKIAGEKVLKNYPDKINISIFRAPLIVAKGRLGLVALFFEFMSEDKRIYVLGKGSNRYQFIYADDICDAMIKATKKKGYNAYGIGADNTPTLRQLYQSVINHAKSKSRIMALPSFPVLQIMNLLYYINMSPIGPYQAGVLGRNMYYDTTKIKRELNWRPKKTSQQMLIENYDWYMNYKKQLQSIDTGKFSTHKSLPRMGIFKIVKWFS